MRRYTLKSFNIRVIVAPDSLDDEGNTTLYHLWFWAQARVHCLGTRNTVPSSSQTTSRYARLRSGIQPIRPNLLFGPAIICVRSAWHVFVFKILQIQMDYNDVKNITIYMYFDLHKIWPSSRHALIISYQIIFVVEGETAYVHISKYSSQLAYWVRPSDDDWVNVGKGRVWSSFLIRQSKKYSLDMQT